MALSPTYQVVLKSLKDIHESTPIEPFNAVLFWGSVGAFFFIAALMCMGGLWYWRRRYRYLVKLQKINHTLKTNKDIAHCLWATNRLLKRVVIHHVDVGATHLFGKKWINFLNQQVPKPLFGKAHANFLYNPHLHTFNDQNNHQAHVFLKAAKDWLKMYRLKRR